MKNSESEIKEFYNLEDLQLNISPENGALPTSWGNLGYWKDLNLKQTSDTYAKACESLACELADFSGLIKQSSDLDSSFTVLDTGFGCGDQLVTWLTRYNITRLYGINLSVSQTQMAKQRISTLSSSDFNRTEQVICRLETGDCCDPEQWKQVPDNVQRILALDCAYHFNNKTEYFRLSQSKLAINGVLAISDLVLNQPIQSPLHKLLLKTICHLSHIPYKQLQTLTEYNEELKTLGLNLVANKDITDHVFMPFGQWLAYFIQDVNRHNKVSGKLNWAKYKGTALFLKWLYKKHILSYQILRIEHLQS